MGAQIRTVWLAATLWSLACPQPVPGREPTADPDPGLTIAWADDMLTIRGPRLPGKELKVWYLEAYCRPGSSNRDWRETVIGHKTELLEARADGRLIKLRCTLNDGVVVRHEIRAGKDAVDFRLIAHNPTPVTSQAHWAQPCVRVARFTGVEPIRASEAYLPKSFILLDGRLARLPTRPWATQARYTPGQVWCPRHVDPDDVNPRPLSTLVPTGALIGCFSADEKLIMATAWEPYQELFQGVIVCLHCDFRIGGLEPGKSKQIRGKIYLMDADVGALLRRYQQDFPEHRG